MNVIPEKEQYTLEDLESWPENPRYELIEGEAVMLAAPLLVHQRISIRISTVIFNYLRGKTCEVFTAPVDVRLFEKDGDTPEDVDTVVQPDILVVCDRNKLDERGIKGAPDMVVEILSPSNVTYDLWKKLKLYEKAGVPEYWVVDPESETVAVYIWKDGRYDSPMLYTKAAKVKVGALDDCWVDLGEVFTE